MVTIEARATDDTGVTKVEFYIDDQLRRTDTDAPWEMQWDTAQEVQGTHTLLAKAFDAADNVGTSEPITVTGGGIEDDEEPPTVNLSSPQDGATVHGTITLEAKASDEKSGISKIEFFVDDTSIGMGELATETGPWERQWDTTSVAEGSHDLAVKATDRAGNTSIDDDTTVMVKQEVLALKETFSDQDGDGDLFDQSGWRIDGWEAHSDNHTVSPAESRSAFGYASSGSGCATGMRTRSLSKRIALGDNPKLSYFRKLDLRAAVNLFTPASFKVLVNDTVVDEESVIGANYTESAWTERANIDLSEFANQTVELAFEVEADSNVCIEVFAKAWVDDVVVGRGQGVQP